MSKPSNHHRRFIAACCAATLAQAAFAQTPDPGKAAVQSIEVKGVKSPARWPYRAFLEGLDAFDEHRALAPNGVLSFVLRPTAPLPDSVSVALDSEIGRQLLPREGMRFAVPRIERYDRRDTELTVAVRDSQFAQDRSDKQGRWAGIVEIGNLPLADVRSPGLPENTFRLGDLRLSCRVSAAVFKEQMAWWLSTMVTGMVRSRNWCDGADSSTFSPRAGKQFIALTLRDGAREQRSTYEQPRDQLPLPSAVHKWSDETLVLIEPAPASSAAAGSP